jgi:hypothetical protein
MSNNPNPIKQSMDKKTKTGNHKPHTHTHTHTHEPKLLRVGCWGWLQNFPVLPVVYLKMKFTPVELGAGAVLYIVVFVSVYCSSMILRIIYRMLKWNGYLVLIYSMTVCELLYDSTFFLLIGYHNHNVYRVLSILFTFGGLSVTLWSNVLSGILWYMCRNYALVDIWRYYKYFFCLCIIPPAIFAIFDGVYCDHAYMAETYNILRFVSIIFNFLVYLGINRRLRLIGASKSSRAIGPLRELASRFKYYPIVQVLCRLPTTGYQLAYGFKFSNFQNVKLSDPGQVAALFLYAATAPSGGIAYFLIFLYMQPQASVEYRRIVRESWIRCTNLFPAWMCCCKQTSDYESLIPSAEETGDDIATGNKGDGRTNSGYSSNFLGASGPRSAGHKTPQRTEGRYGQHSVESEELMSPLPVERSGSGNEIEVGGIFLRAEDCWRQYRGMDEEELESNMRSEDS